MLIFSVFSIPLKEMEKTEKLRETFYLKMIKKEKKGGKVKVFKRILTTTTQSLVIVPSQGTLVVMEVLVLLIMMVLTCID